MFWLITAISIFTFFGSLAALPILIVRLPEDYFIRQPVRDWPTRHPLVHILLVIAKNIFGVGLVLAGIAMLVLPGQGLLTILVGLMLLDFPGKRRLERRLIQIPPVLNSINWIRMRYHRKPLRVDPESNIQE